MRLNFGRGAGAGPRWMEKEVGKMRIFEKRKYLLLLPLVFLVFNAFYYRLATHEIQSTLLQEKVVEITNEIDLLAEAVEANTDRPWYEHEANIIGFSEYMDNLYQVYAATYKASGGDFTIITRREFETSPFEPFDYPHFVEMIDTQESGSIAIRYAPEGQAERDLYIYFRWMPLYSPQNDRYLVLGGVSTYSVVSEIPFWVSAGQWVSTAATFAMQVWIVALVARFGRFKDARGEKS